LSGEMVKEAQTTWWRRVARGAQAGGGCGFCPAGSA